MPAAPISPAASTTRPGPTWRSLMRSVLVRSVLAAAVAGCLTATLGRVATQLVGGLSAPGTRGLEGGVAALAVGVGAAALAVVTVGCLLTALGAASRLSGRSLARLEATASRLTPALVRRAIAVGVGTGLLASVAGGATAAEPDAPSSTSTSSASTSTGYDSATDPADLGWQITSIPGPSDVELSEPTPPEPAPDPVTTGAEQTGSQQTRSLPAAAAPAGEPAGPAPEIPSTPGVPAAVTVEPGDSLWTIAAAHLPGGSPNAAIAAAWPRWYAANRAVIGDDPNLIHPGQVLSAPEEVRS